MNTPSHFLVTAAMHKCWFRRHFNKWACWLGAVAPDIPLILLFIGLIFYGKYFPEQLGALSTHELFDYFFYHDPYWISLHNALHSPVVLIAGMKISYEVLRRRPSARAGWWFAFFASCMLHSLIDIATHHDDGPLLFWPLDWQTRFQSPVSYWDSSHYGQTFSIFEFWFDILLLVYLIVPLLMAKARGLFRFWQADME